MMDINTDIEAFTLEANPKTKEIDEYRKELNKVNKRQIISKNSIPSFLIRENGNGQKLSKFEKVLISDDNKTSIISLVLEKYESKEFWTKDVSLKTVFQHYFGNSSANLQNFFTILVFDWCSQSETPRKYYLEEKFTIYEEASAGNETIFDKIFDIYNDESLSMFYHTCLRIIYHYFDEVNSSYDYYFKKEGPKHTVYDYSYMRSLISQALKIKVYWYKVQIVKVLVAFCKNTKDDEFNYIRDEIFDTFDHALDYKSICEISYQEMTQHCDGKFFKLAFYLRENLVQKFKIEFRKFIKAHKQFYGEFWMHAIKLNAQLLYHMASNQELVDTKETILLSTSIHELKHSIASYFIDYADFRVVFYDSLTDEEEKQWVSINIY